MEAPARRAGASRHRGVVASAWWPAALGRSLVCEASPASSDAILVENSDPDYLLFARATGCAGPFATRVLVPVASDLGTPELSEVGPRHRPVHGEDLTHRRDRDRPHPRGRADHPECGRDVQRFLERERIRSVIVVTPLFRSRRSPARLRRHAGPRRHRGPFEPSRVAGSEHWTRSWHGIQEVAEQWLKLQYYRLCVLPFV